MANIFDIPTKQTYVDTYVPLPFQAIAAVGDKIQKQNADTESAMSALQNEIAKLNVVGQVEVGPGVFRPTGYKEHKDNLLKNTESIFNKIAEDHIAGKTDANQFTTAFNNARKEILGDYEKLKFASGNSKTIDEQAKLVRLNKDSASDKSVLNLHYKENQRLLDNPFSNEYMGAAIDEITNENQAQHQTAAGIQKKFLGREQYTSPDGIRRYTTKSGVSKNDIINLVNSSFDNDPIGHQAARRINFELEGQKDQNGNDVTWNTPYSYTQKVKDAKGHEKEVTINTTVGDYKYNKYKEKYTQGVIAIAETTDFNDHYVNMNTGRGGGRGNGEDKDPSSDVTPMDQNILNPSGKIDLNANNPLKEFGQFDDNGNFISNNITMNNSLKELDPSYADPKLANPLNLIATTSSAGAITATQKGQVVLSNEKLKMVKNYYKNVMPTSFKGTVDEYIQSEAKKLGTDIDGIGNIAIGLIAKNYKEATSFQKAIPVFNATTKKSLTDRFLPSDSNPAGSIVNSEVRDMNGVNKVFEDNEEKIKAFQKSNIITGSNNLPGYFVVQLQNGDYLQVDFQDPVLKANHEDLINFNNSISNTLKTPISSETVKENNSSVNERYNSSVNKINKQLLNLDQKTQKSMTPRAEKAKEVLKNWKNNYNQNIDILKENGYVLALSRKVNIAGQLQDVAVFNKYATNQNGVDQKIYIVNPDGQFIKENQANINAAIMPYLFQNNIQNALSTETDAKKSTNLYIK